MTSPSNQSFCETLCSCEAGGADAFRLRRHDTCPAMEIVVRGKNNEPVDLTDWTATATLFYIRRIYSPAADDDTLLYLDATKSVNIGDVIRAETPDAPRELMLVSAVDREADTITVTRGHDSTTPVALPDEQVLVGLKATDIPVEIVLETLEAQQASYYQVEAGTPSDDPVIVSSKLLVKWRSSDTLHAGDYYVQVELENTDTGEKMTLPRGSTGYPVRISQDANDT